MVVNHQCCHVFQHHEYKKSKAVALDNTSASNHGFLAEIVQHLHFLLHHPLGLPLTCLLENKSERKNFSDHQLEMKLKLDAFDYLFNECYSSWTKAENPGEPVLTTTLSTRMGEAIKASNLEALHQYLVSQHPPGKINVLAGLAHCS